jgi:hypothetical protein
MKTKVLWKLPGVALKQVPGGWRVKSERGWGTAHAVFVPVRQEAPGKWQLHPLPAEMELAAVHDRQWGAVPLDRSLPSQHYLCMLRYDQPLGRPDRSVARSKFLPPKDFATRAAPTTEGELRVPGSELQSAFAQVCADAGDRLGRYVVTAPRPPRAWRGDALRSHLSFAFASCQYPAGMLDRTMAHASYRALTAHVHAAGLPQRLLLLGDQVYVDATYGLLDPLRLDDAFRLAYEEFADRETGPFSELPQDLIDRTRLTPDDHEIVDDWEPVPGAPDPRRELGLDAFWEHQRLGERRREAVQLRDRGRGWRLFMTDSRTQREARSCDNVESATLLGERQTRQLERWLRCMPPGELKIVTSAAMLLPRTRENIDEPLHLDNWQGYPASLRGLLALLCELQVRNIVFLSGDAHLACSARIVVHNDHGRSVSFQSHHAPALYAPYPFANESRWNLLLDDRFTFQHQGRGYHCTVNAQILADGANGCGWLEARREGSHWDTSARVLGA